MSKFDFNDVLATISHIKGGLPIQRLTSRVRLGEHRSSFFGIGDFYDIKVFDPESDLPSMIVQIPGGDPDEIYARRCIENREQKVNFLVDISSSLDVGLYLHKRRMLLDAIGFIGATGIRYQDPVGLVGFTDKVVLNLKPRYGGSYFFYLLKTVYDFLQEHDPNDRKAEVRKTDYFTVFDFVARNFDRPCFLPVVSDFIGFEKVLDSKLFKIVNAKHELMFFFLDDPVEYYSSFGFGYVTTRDVETGKLAVKSRRKMAKIERQNRQNRKVLRNELRSMGIQSVVLEFGKQFKRLNRFFVSMRKQAHRL